MANQNSSEYIRLKELNKSKYELAKHQANIISWYAKNGQGRILGKVDDLLFDVESKKVLYVILDLTGNEMHLKDRKVLVPLSIAEINEAYQNVLFPGVMSNEITELPTYEPGKVSTKIEDIVQHAFVNTLNHNETVGEQESGLEERPYQVPNDAVGIPFQAKTVIGVFENKQQAQTAIEYLLEHDVTHSQIGISPENPDEFNINNHSIHQWLMSIMKNESDIEMYEQAAKNNCIVSVQTISLHDAERVAEIFDSYGALSLDYTSDSKYKSRIID